jgi:hypothetical protein
VGSRLPRRKQAQRRAQLPIIAGQRSGEQLEPPSGDAAKRMADHGRAALLLYGVALVDMAASSLTFALTPGRVIELGGDAKTIGLLSGFVGALQLVAGPLVGRYSDRLADRRWVLILGLLASALGSAVASLAADPMTFFLSRVPAGLFAHTLNQLRAVRPTAKLCFPPSRCRHRAPAAASAALQPAAPLRARLTARSASLALTSGHAGVRRHRRRHCWRRGRERPALCPYQFCRGYWSGHWLGLRWSAVVRLGFRPGECSLRGGSNYGPHRPAGCAELLAHRAEGCPAAD